MFPPLSLKWPFGLPAELSEHSAKPRGASPAGFPLRPMVPKNGSPRGWKLAKAQKPPGPKSSIVHESDSLLTSLSGSIMLCKKF